MWFFRQAIRLWMLCIGLATHLSAQEMGSVFGEALSGRPSAPSLGYQYRLYPEAGLQGYEVAMQQHDANFLSKLSSDERQRWTLFGRYQLTQLNEAPLLPSSTVRFPEQLWNLQTGSGYLRRYDGGHVLAADFMLGSSGDAPFTDAEEIALSAAAMFKLQRRQSQDAWVFLAQFSNHRSFLNYVPLPGLGYFWDRGSKLQALLGVPIIFVVTSPAPSWLLRLFAIAPYRLDAGATWFFFGPFRLELGGRWGQQSWFREGRNNGKDQLFYDEVRGVVGLKGPIFPGMQLEIEGGYAFWRKLFEGESYTDRNTGTLDLADAPTVSASVRYRF
jgi:hypothetical protein